MALSWATVTDVPAQIGPYSVVREIGRGCMGVVYLARDERLDRDVAIKALPEDLASDPGRLERFEREGKALAQLNHPNVAGIHGVEEQDGRKYLVLEYVEGDTTGDRLEAGPIPVEEALELAVGIASGLEAAHEAGVIHRDLKPDNIKITREGVIKVLDFGLARTEEGPSSSVVAQGLADSPTVTSPVRMHSPTVPGVIMGTPGYMSPEQARGKPVDKRSDIFSFGCVLFEMLSGQMPFHGETVADAIGATLHKELDFGLLPPSTPPRVRELLTLCLAKDRKNRLRDVGDARLELERAISDPRGTAPSAPGSHPWWRSPAVLLTASLLAIIVTVAATAFFALRYGAHSQRGSTRARSFEPKTFGQQTVYTARFLPDDQGIVYSSALTGNKPDVYLLQQGSIVPQKIAPHGTLLLSVSAQGELAVLTDTEYVIHRVHSGTLARMTVDGAPRALIEEVHDADWGPDGELAIARRRSDLDRLEYPPGHVLYETSGYISEPRVSADGSRVAFLDHSFWMDDRGWVKVVDLEGTVTTLSDEYRALEGLTWAYGGERLSFSGASSATTDQLQVYTTGLRGPDVRREFEFPGDVVVLDASAAGRWLIMQQDHFVGVAVWLPGQSKDTDLSWLDQSWKPSLSPDGETLVFTNGHGAEGYSVVTRRLDGSPISTLGEGEALGFSPDGRWVAARLIASQGIVLYPTGAGAPRPLPRGPLEYLVDAQWYPDGKNLLITGHEPSRAVRMYRQSIEGGLPEPMTPEGIAGLLSPKGDRVIALDSESTWRLYSLDETPPRTAPGLDALEEVFAWSPKGDAVYVRREQTVPLQLERVDLETGGRTKGIEIGPRQQAGLVWISIEQGGLRVFDPAVGHAYDYGRQLSRLFLVQ